MERRHFQTSLEVRAADGQPPKLVGYAAVFHSDSEDFGGFVERVMPGAFASSIKRGDMVALADHDLDKPLANQKAGSLVLQEDERGLYVEITPTEASWGKDTVTAAREGNKAGMSFGFNWVEGGTEWRKDGGKNVRVIKNIDALEVSVVTRGAYPAAGIKVRGLDKAQQLETYGTEIAQLEAILVSVKRGLKLTTDEMEVARQTVEVLRGAIRHPMLEAAIDRAAKVLV